MMHTGNVNKYSFAAEVKFHADHLGILDFGVENLGNFIINVLDIDRQISIYTSALRAEMMIGLGYKYDPEHYYDLEHDCVKEQVEEHEKC